MNDVSRCSRLAAAQRGSYISACLIRVNTHTPSTPPRHSVPAVSGGLWQEEHMPPAVLYRTHMQTAKQTTRAVMTS